MRPVAVGLWKDRNQCLSLTFRLGGRTLLVYIAHNQVEALRRPLSRLSAKLVEQVCPSGPVGESALDSLKAWLASAERGVDERDLDDCRKARSADFAGLASLADEPKRCRRVP